MNILFPQFLDNSQYFMYIGTVGIPLTIQSYQGHIMVEH